MTLKKKPVCISHVNLVKNINKKKYFGDSALAISYYILNGYDCFLRTNLSFCFSGQEVLEKKNF